jgi:hypoxia up-regulated 1
MEASSEPERVSIRKKLEEASEWLWDQGDNAPTKDLKSAKSELEWVTEVLKSSATVF